MSDLPMNLPEQREPESIDRFQNNCTLVAVREVSRKADAEILAAFRKHGYVNNDGVRDEQWSAAAIDLGLHLRSLPFSLFHDRAKARWTKRTRHWSSPYFDDMEPESENNKVSVLRKGWLMTVKKFTELYPTGTFLIRVNAHVFVVRIGVILDPNMRKAGLARYVRGAYEVMNAPPVAKKGTIRVLVPPARARRMLIQGEYTRSYKIYVLMVDYVRRNPFVTKENIFANVPGYGPKDWAWDIKRSNIMEE